MTRHALAALTLLWFIAAAPALAQSPPMYPAMTYGMAPTVGQWNNWFQQKQDTLGYVPVNRGGDTLSGRLVTTASTLARSGLNIQPGIAPTSPVNGDIWTTAAGVYIRINGSTIGPLVGGAGVSCAANTVSLTTLVVTAGVVTHC